MYCRNCGAEIDPNAAMCVKCGFAKGTGDKFCENCGNELYIMSIKLKQNPKTIPLLQF